MAALGFADCGDGVRVPARSKPVQQLRADGTALGAPIRGRGRPFAPRNQEHDARAGFAGDVQTAQQALVGGVERMFMQIEREIGRKRASAQAAFPV